MSSPDPISLVALIVSLVALTLTLLQVAQQYVSTSYDYRHCSARTVGGWHKRSRRRFVWSELRFEVYFATPIIHIGVLDRDTQPPPTKVLGLERGGADYILHTHEGDKLYTSSQKPWFLDDTRTQPEAKCSWLSLLNDATVAHLQIGINERTLSYDFMPDGIKKPLARMDRGSFLTLMSLFQVSWQQGWDRQVGEEIEIGGGKIATPTGAGPYCEVTSRILANFGPVISYQPNNFQSARRIYIVSENARSAMFNRFDLGFEVVLTHSADEAYSSALALAGEGAADSVRSLYLGNNGWSPGLGEVIACFAEPEMPKAIEHGTDKFISIYSARSLGSILDDYPIGRLLNGEELENSTLHAKEFAEWAKNYMSVEPSLHVKENGISANQLDLRTALEFAVRYLGTESETDRRRPISWSESRKCLDGIKWLDAQLSVLCRLLAPTQAELSVHRELAQLQVRFGSTLFQDASARAQESTGNWRDLVGVVVAEKYVEICFVLGQKYPTSSDEVRRGFIINRLMRGVLWRIHNGNHPTSDTKRQWECSLNSHWLSDTSTLWVD